MSHVNGTGSGDSTALLLQIIIELLTPREGEGSTEPPPIDTHHHGPDLPAPPPVDPAEVAKKQEQADAEAAANVQTNIEARQAIREAFLRVARDKGGVGDEKGERQIDRLLFNMLPQIDFSQPGGDKFLQEIINFISSLGKKVSEGEVNHLKGLLNEGAMTLAPPPPVTDQPVPDLPEPPETPDPTEELLALLAQVLADGKIDETERAALLEKVSDLAARMPAEETGGEETGGEETGGEINPAGPGGCVCPPERPDPEDNTDEVFAGVLQLLIDLLKANEDGEIDSDERADLMKDVVALLQKLLDDGGGTDDGGGIVASPNPDPGGDMTTRSGNHDSLWFLDQSGLRRFLSSLSFGEGSRIEDMVEEMLGDNTQARGQGSVSM